ncbi:MAG: glycoside hydrolase family 97 protein [Bacteroidales bacterium]|nr:glycoside hydrolase family 97 protein [Bacteroidales bacterium]
MKVSNSFIIGILLSVLNIPVFSQKSDNLVVTSPDKSISVTVKLQKGKLYYQIAKDNKVIIAPSSLGLKFKNIPHMIGDFSLVGKNISSFDNTWEQPWGEQRWVRNNYNELSISLKDKLKREMQIVFRVFNDGVGFRYQIPAQPSLDSLIIMDETTEFNFTQDEKAWWIPVHRENSYYESIYRLTSISNIDTANTPITFELQNGLYLAIHEANLTDYASMTLEKKKEGHGFISCLIPWSNGVKVYAKAPMSSPWRIFIIGRTPGELATSTLMLNLNEPCVLSDISWVKPSKYIGIWWGMHLGTYTWSQGPNHGATTANTLRYIDFAAKHGFDGVLVEGWNYGWDGNWYENGNTFSFTKPYPDFDLEYLAQYARSKNIQLIGHHETGGAVSNYERQMEEAFQLYNRLGIRYVKTGYVNKYLDGKEWHDGQYGVRHYRKVVELAAKYQINIDNHEPIKPTGLCRTYPNLMTQEGGRGQEYDAWSPDGGNPPSHTTTLPFTRMLAGPFDFTPGTFNFSNPANPKTRVQTTLAKQLALFVVIYSPLQMASDLPENYEGKPAFEFIKRVPCDWEITLVPQAKIGEYVVTVRKDRNSDNWYVGAITNELARELKLKLDFLNPNSQYKAHIYIDGENANWQDNPYDIKIFTIPVKAGDELPLRLAAGGGAAIEIVKQ